MRERRHLVAAFLLFALAVVSIEHAHLHAAGGGVPETQCSACLLQLTTQAVAGDVFSPPAIVPLDERVAVPPAVTHEQAESRRLTSRGPPPVSRAHS